MFLRVTLRAIVIVQQKSEYRIIRLSDFEFSMLSRRGIRGPIIKNQWDPGSKTEKLGVKGIFDLNRIIVLSDAPFGASDNRAIFGARTNIAVRAYSGPECIFYFRVLYSSR